MFLNKGQWQLIKEYVGHIKSQFNIQDFIRIANMDTVVWVWKSQVTIQMIFCKYIYFT